MTEHVHDVAVVGAGVVGAAVARLLARSGLDVALVEANPDVGAGTSKANTAILHTGFDAVPGSVEARLVARGYHLLREHAPLAGISVEETGAVLVAWDDEQAGSLPKLHAKAVANGYLDAVVLDAADVRSLEPHLGPGVTGGMLVPGEHLVDPWTPPLSFTRDALANGATLFTSARVETVEVGDDTTVLTMTDGRHLRTRHVVNAAGLFGDRLHHAFGLGGFTIRPRRGELIVFDKLARPLLSRTILPVPTSHTKGVLVAPTVFGNVVLGPTADDIDDPTATGSTRAGLDGLIEKGRRILPALIDEEVTAVYAGLRAATQHSDYQLSAHADLRYVCLGGIRSTGLTASMALAEEAATLLASIGLEVPPAPTDPPPVQTHATPLGEAGPRPYEGGAPIVCHCERVTAGEIETALADEVPPVDIDGLRRRTRALAGRCQGFHCTATIAGLTGWPVDR